MCGLLVLNLFCIIICAAEELSQTKGIPVALELKRLQMKKYYFYYYSLYKYIYFV